MRPSRPGVYVLLLVGVLCGTPNADAIPLGTLVAGDTITVGDKLFSNFSVSNVATQNSTPDDPLDIDVVGITNVLGEHGLRLSGIGTAVTPGGTPGALAFFLEYDVTVLDPFFVLHDVRHSFTSTANRGGSISLITQAGFPPDVNASMQAVVGSSGMGELVVQHVDEDELFDTAVVMQHMLHAFELHAQVVNLTNQGGPIVQGQIDTGPIDLTYSQTFVPEPSSLMLLGTGAAALALRLKRRRTPDA